MADGAADGAYVLLAETPRLSSSPSTPATTTARAAAAEGDAVTLRSPPFARKPASSAPSREFVDSVVTETEAPPLVTQRSRPLDQIREAPHGEEDAAEKRETGGDDRDRDNRDRDNNAAASEDDDDDDDAYRYVYLNAPEANAALGYCSNRVVTSRFTVYNFVPKLLFYEFKKLANAYFLVISVMQTIKPISNTGGFPASLPALSIIVLIDMFFACLEDYKRHKADHIADLAGVVVCETPNNAIHRFHGSLALAGGATKEAISTNAVLLRGSTLRNTEFVYGLVVNTGPDTKIMRASSSTPLKWSNMERRLNQQILYICALMLVLCVTGATASTVWNHANLSREAGRKAWYLYDREATAVNHPVGNFVIQVLYYFLLLNSFIPVSLYVSMTSTEVGIAAKKRRAAEHVQQPDLDRGAGSTPGGVVIMEERDDDDEPLDASRDAHRVVKAPFVNYQDDAIFDALAHEGSTQAERIHLFFEHLGVCHTVMPERAADGSLRLSASSPDEQALVAAAACFGYKFVARSPGKAMVEYCACSNESDTATSSQPVAGNTRLRRSTDPRVLEMRNKTLLDMEVFASEGLRTLVIAEAEVDAAFFEGWVRIVVSADTHPDLEAIMAELERYATVHANDDERSDAVYSSGGEAGAGSGAGAPAKHRGLRRRQLRDRDASSAAGGGGTPTTSGTAESEDTRRLTRIESIAQLNSTREELGLVIDGETLEVALEECPELLLRNSHFNTKIVWAWISSCVWESLVISFGTLYGMRYLSVHGDTPTMWVYGCTAFSIVLLVVTLKLCLHQQMWWPAHLAIYAGSVSLWVVTAAVISSGSSVSSAYWNGVFTSSFGVQVFWLLVPLLTFTALSRDFLWKGYERAFRPSYKHLAQEVHAFGLDRFADALLAFPPAETIPTDDVEAPLRAELPSGPLASTRSTREALKYAVAASAGQIHMVPARPAATGAAAGTGATGARVPGLRKSVSRGSAFSYDAESVMVESFMATERYNSRESEARTLFDRHASRGSMAFQGLPDAESVALALGGAGGSAPAVRGRERLQSTGNIFRGARHSFARQRVGSGTLTAAQLAGGAGAGAGAVAGSSWGTGLGTPQSGGGDRDGQSPAQHGFMVDDSGSETPQSNDASNSTGGPRPPVHRVRRYTAAAAPKLGRQMSA
ncbi:hypothetical protein PybrP1_011655 [[Pythium] brassicae (nom. inval.)]|nr:hypothetical protein PybrP1_011655 [[Pythium] brassicae (nom. inval.)]